MRTGKLPEHTFKRSVINPIRHRNKETAFRAGVGHDGAVIGDMVTSMATTAFSYTGNEIYALDNAVNNVIAAGGRPYGIATAILMPEHSVEAELRAVTGRICQKAQEYELEVLAGHTELVPSVSSPVITVTAYGKKIWDNRHKEVCAGMDIVMTKWVGLYGGAILAALKEEELVTRYPKSYIRKAADYMRNTSLMPELAVIEKAVKEKSDCIFAAHDVSNGGIFGALWQFLSACGAGGVFDIRHLAIKQEIIEVCEYFDINPYMINGQGSLLLVTSEGEYITEQMQQAGIYARIIGKTDNSAERKILVGEEERFLVPPKGDALNAVFYGQPLPV